MRLKENLDKLNWDKFDTIVFAGGQLFMDYFVHWIAIIVSYAEKYNKKVVFNCCGMGKLSSKSVKLLCKVFQSDSIYSITIRDGVKQFKSLLEVRMYYKLLIQQLIVQMCMVKEKNRWKSRHRYYILQDAYSK